MQHTQQAAALTTCHGWELLGINLTPKIDSREFKSSGNSPLNQFLQSFAYFWAGVTIIYYDCRGETALGLGAA